MVSVVVPTRNESAALPRLLASLGRQGLPLDVVVADADSTDDTRDIARAWGARVVDGGLPGVGRNAGARVVRHDALVFLDADVELPDGFLAQNLAEFRARRLAIATARYVPISTRRVDRAVHAAYNAYARATQRVYPLAAGFCLFTTRTVHDRIGGFDERIRLASDLNYVKRCAAVGRFGILHGPPVRVSVRRLDAEGRWGLLRKYARGYLHRVFRGEMVNPPFDYVFNGGVNARVEPPCEP